MFKVGDKVRIRQWDDMAKQFGLDLYGDIRLPNNDYFVRSMANLCGKEYKIEEINGAIIQRIDMWNITTDMLEPIKDGAGGKPKTCDFKVGDMVKVMHTDGCFSTYEGFFAENGISKDIARRFKRGVSIPVGVYRILAIGKHADESWYGNLYAVSKPEGGTVYIIAEKSPSRNCLELVEPAKPINAVEQIKVIRNGPATIVILPDGRKGVAKCHPDDEYKADEGLKVAMDYALAVPK
jgi:hypothetical protein